MGICLFVFSTVGRQRPTLAAHPGRPTGWPSSHGIPPKSILQLCPQMLPIEFLDFASVGSDRRWYTAVASYIPNSIF